MMTVCGKVYMDRGSAWIFFPWNCVSQLVTDVLRSQVSVDEILYLVNPFHSVRKILLMRSSPFK